MSNVDLSWINNMSDDERSRMTASIAARPATDNSVADQAAKAMMEKWLKDFGLSAMSGRVWDYMVANGVGDEAGFSLFIYTQPEFAKRFPAFKALQDKGMAITPTAYIELERNYASVLKGAGISASFFDRPDDFTELIANGVSPNQFYQRVVDGYQRVAGADPLIRKAFSQYFGVNGDSALAAYFIDPDRAQPKLMQQVAQAEIGAAGKQAGVDVDLRYATRLANMGVNYTQAMEGMRRLSQLDGLFSSSMGEAAISSTGAGIDITPPEPPAGPTTLAPAQPGRKAPAVMPSSSTIKPLGTPGSGADDVGLDYVFGTNEEVQKKIALRLESRKAQASGTNQQAVMDKRGGTNLGSAK